MALEKRTPQVETQVSVVFVTASKTFDGPVAGYTTMLPSGFGINDGTLSASSAPQPTSQPNQNTPAPAPQSSTKPRHTTEQSQPSEVASTTQSAAQSSPLGTSSSPSETSSRNTHAPSTLTSPSAPTITSGAPSKISSLTISPTESSSLQATTPESGDTAPAVSSSPSESSGNSGGLSGGAKAGLAIGIILLIALIAGGAFFLYRYKKRQDESHEKLEDDEKTAATGAGAFVPAREPSVRSTRTPTNAPRLSLRPLTQFSPNLGGAPATVGNKLEMTSNPSGASQQPKSMWERPGERNDITEKSNPFGDHAASAAAPVAAGAVAGAAVGAAVRSKANDRRRSSGVVPKPLSIKSNHSQTSLDSEVSSAHTGTLSSANISEFHLGTASTASSAIPASVAASSVPSSLAAPSGPPSNVHRVQMEFKPSMEDELELLPGQIVRILHEYDDGWVSLYNSSLATKRVLISNRPFAFEWTALSKVSLHAHVFPSFHSSLALSVRRASNLVPVQPALYQCARLLAPPAWSLVP